MAQVALAWILSKDGMLVDSQKKPSSSWPLVVTAPIVGISSLEKLHDSISMFCLFSSHPFCSCV